MDDLAVRIRAIAEQVHALQQELARAAGQNLGAPARRHRLAIAGRFRALYDRLQDFLLLHHPTPLPVRGRRLPHGPRPD